MTNLRNALIEMGIITAVALALLAAVPAKSECNCSSANSAEGHFGEPRSQAQRDANAAALAQSATYWGQLSGGIPEVSREEYARWSTVGSYLYNKEPDIFSSIANLFAVNAYPTQYNTWGAVTSDSGHVGPGYGNK